MPELPEVETLVAQLSRVLPGRRISEVQIRNESLLETPRPELQDQVVGKRIVQIARRGKYIRMDLSRGFSLWFHLGMTGQLLYSADPRTQNAYTHFTAAFENSPNRFYFRDVRRFGGIFFTNGVAHLLPEKIRLLGPDPFEIQEKAFVDLLKTQGRLPAHIQLLQTLLTLLAQVVIFVLLH